MAVKQGMTALLEMTANHDFQQLSRYLDLVEEHLEGVFREWKERFKRIGGQLSGENRAEYFAWMSEEYWGHKDYQRILRNSFLVTVMALLEGQLGRICRLMVHIVETVFGAGIPSKGLRRSTKINAYLSVYYDCEMANAAPKNLQWFPNEHRKALK